MIEHLSTDEASIITYLKDKDFIEYCDFRGHNKSNDGFRSLISRQTLIERDVKLTYPQNIQAYISNLESLGILSDQSGFHKINTQGEEEIKTFIIFHSLESELVPKVFQSITVHRCFFNVTDLGKMFIKACVK